ncbi:MAG: Stp1/IreP family PP2C-type Ser/Thr phosphatase [Lachnospiraceae bacterium]|nr:Stp1/IreP family PP2C-type Ser/Thr phosphatase [Lachnospiraceae bacterium]MDD7378470.1 Stp1/IreP family PP2C-type Ser/Thr phosphatase [Lachnospiraceae bacterium]
MKTFSISDIGKNREMNQDYVYTSENAVGNLPNLFIVADGMGGHKAGEFASRFTVETIVESVRTNEQKEPVRIIEEAIQTANRELIQKARQDETMAGMGTTVVVVTVIGDKAFVANVGDSRMYVIGKEISQITRDHSLVEEMVRMGELAKDAAKDHPDKNIITRAVGAAQDVDVDFFEVELYPQDYILMCSDGLTNMVEDEDIRRIVQSQRDVAERVEKLVETANDHGGQDNITVVVIEPF